MVLDSKPASLLKTRFLEDVPQSILVKVQSNGRFPQKFEKILET